jgi:putative membrane-bound dehydrogenase-like protein
MTIFLPRNPRTLLWLLGSSMLVTACQSEEKGSSFLLHPEFDVELVASEPLIFDPVDLEFDDHGDAYVLQMPGYPKGIDQSSIVKLLDQDQDGIYDEKVVFAENLAQASSLLPWREGFLVAAPPDLLYLRDTDGDGKADERQVLMSGYTTGNLQHNFNGLVYGLDHWIYVANGGNGGSTFWPDSPDSLLRIGGSDFRIKPEKRLFQLTGRSSGGFELAMDDWGRIFGTHNLHHINTIVFPHGYIDGLNLKPTHTLLNISDHEENGLARVYPIGEQETRVNHPEQSGYFSGACGITYYGGGAFSSAFNRNIFVNDVVLNLVHRDVLQPDGVTIKASRGRQGVDFMASSDRSFRPVNVAVGPDGALYIVDMYRTVIEHPEWIPDEIEVDLDLDAGKEQGRIYRITQKNHPLFTWQRPADVTGLITLLSHPNQWQRITAQRLIVEENDEEARDLLLKTYEQTNDALTRVHILYTLRELGVDLENLLMSCLEGPEPLARQQGLRLTEPYLSNHTAFREKVLSMTRDVDPGVQMQATLTLSTLGADLSDRVIEAIRPVVSAHYADPYVRMACVAAAKHDPLKLARIMVEEDLLAADGTLALAGMLAARVAQTGTSRDQQALLHIFNGPEPEKIAAVAAVLESLSTSGLDPDQTEKTGWTRFLNQLESTGRLPIISAAWRLRRSLNLPPPKSSESVVTEALTNIQDESMSEAEIIESARLLAYAKSKPVIDALFQLVDARKPTKIQQVALDVLQGFDDPEITAALVDKWSTLSPTIRKRVSDMLIYNPQNHELLFSSFESGRLNLSEFNFDLERRRRLLKSKDEKTRLRAEKLFSDAGVVQRKDAIEQMRPALMAKGNPRAGRKVFDEQCGTCHRFGKIGQDVGPDLTEISRKSKETLLHDILDPNAGADPEYINHIVDMSDGQVYSGIIEDETDDAISLRMMGGSRISVAKNQIKELSSTGLSLMPEGLEGAMTVDQMADLLAFLQQNPE